MNDEIWYNIPRAPKRARRENPKMFLASAIIYTRFSPGADSEESRSGEMQRKACEAFCAQLGVKVRAVYADESKSGSDEAREPLWEALRDLKHSELLVVYSRDRLARSVFLSEYIRRKVSQKGAKIVAVTGDMMDDTPETLLVRQVLDAVAEYERKLISRRTSESMRRLQSNGFRVGGKPPFGWRVSTDGSKRLDPEPREQAIVRRILQMRDDGLSCNAISDALNSEGTASAPRTGKWQSAMISRILRRSVVFPPVSDAEEKVPAPLDAGSADML